MIDNLFLQIVNMSFTGGVVIIFVLIVRLLLRKAPKIFSYCLWGVALFRLICPFSFESILSFIPVNPEPISNDILYSQAPQISTGISGVDFFVNSSIPTVAIHQSVSPLQIWVYTGATMWMAGILILLAYSLISFFRFKRKLENPIYEKDNIYHISRLDTPFVFGIIRPKIYLPVSLSKSERDYILLHEQTHIRRFDHVFRIISYFTLCIHWFNPLVWIAFYISGKDMEMSCDELVIKKLGDQVKKDYSTCLLSLATGRKSLSATPLAFGEGDTSSRIKNVLKYKKPDFWVIVIAFSVILALSLGLLSNPKQKSLTIEDYANQYVQHVIEDYEKSEYQSFKIVDHKITKLEKIDVFDKVLPYPIETWSLEYRLKPDDINKVMFAGGMNADNGWVTEDSSMGKPVMIFSYEKEDPEFLGMIWTGEMGSMLSSQEIALRRFLEASGKLTKEFFTSEHIIVKFKLSTGETSQALLSQPAAKGDEGIWCVERWMDGNGNSYYNDPQVDSSLNEYYMQLQAQYDNGNYLYLTNPSEVALEFINNTLRQSVDKHSIELLINVSKEDFLQAPISTYVGFISNFAESYPELFHFDSIEWITIDNTERINELGISTQDMPNGYYVHNPSVDILSFMINEETIYNFIDWGNDFVPEGEDRKYSTTSKEEFIRYLSTYSDEAAKVPFWIETKNGYVKSITEEFVN